MLSWRRSVFNGVRILWLAAAVLLMSSSVWAGEERALLEFDSRPWKAVRSENRGQQRILQYVPSGQSAELWNEMATAQFFSGLQDQTDAPSFVARVEEEMRRRCPDLKWRILRRSVDDITYTWSVSACGADGPESEVARVVRGAQGVHVLHYIKKGGPLDEDTRTRWTELLNLAQLVEKS